MKGRQLIVVEPGRIELQEFEVDGCLQPHEALVDAEYSIVSAGTEGAGFTGLVREMPFGDAGTYPRGTGYGHMGRVLEVGSAVEMCREGDRVLSFSRHASLVKADAVRMALPVPEDADGRHLVFARMARVRLAACLRWSCRRQRLPQAESAIAAAAASCDRSPRSGAGGFEMPERLTAN